MAGHKKFSLLRQQMSPRRRERNEQAVREEMKTVLLGELRRAAGRTQTQLADAMGKRQSAISKLESQRDMQVSMLTKVVEGLGGKLRIVATIGNEDFALSVGKQRH
jgi:ribosome-binding protein aMBF1 (putative translation factor)